MSLLVVMCGQMDKSNIELWIRKESAEREMRSSTETSVRVYPIVRIVDVNEITSGRKSDQPAPGAVGVMATIPR